MAPMRLVTWNLLHPIHGQNYDEFPMRAANYNEPNRIDNITQYLRVIIESRRDEVLLVALQEVSLQQLIAVDTLTASFGGTAHSFRLDRETSLKMDKARRGFGLPNIGPEFEMVLAFGANVSGSSGASFGNDSGKGYCVVDVPDQSLAFVSAHISYGPNRDMQIQQLLDVMSERRRRHQATFIVAGDFNCRAEFLEKKLVDFDILQCEHWSVLSATCPTRIGKHGPSDVAGQETLDHFIVVSANEIVCPVLRVHDTSVRALSDHLPVEAILE